MGGEEYRRKARECLSIARQIADEKTRAEVLEMASMWRRLAARAERRTSASQQEQQTQPRNKLPN